MTIPDRDRRIAEWVRKYGAATRVEMLRKSSGWKCPVCNGATANMLDLCPSCWQRIAECVEKADPSNRDPEKN